MLPKDRFVNCVYTVKISQQFKWLGIPYTVIFAHAVCKPAHSNERGPLLGKV